ncbi:ABC transporter substrate-binding protein [Pigmentiphaga kullae]|uniref:Amino acid/amide ABC transporter substrate-binding protein (HAAT family) n=1 Tax=Pigmentiphaga kullae TaxID=151784 RepID=A0A4Q7N7X5_9BURK|nr:ABC transporter substrate-binding protein [Pigmentiphaga kullae]RZS78172.1 amino acid/amide ABC transporter substrate-binding protein (HAAT family) [Pigmentiphaga kullae]
MRIAKRVAGLLCAAAAVAAAGEAAAAEIKVGLLSQFSGAYTWWGREYQRGVDLYLAQRGGKFGEHTITVLSRDEAGSNPQRARQLSQELVVRDKVQYLIGGVFTPTVLGAVDVINQTKTPYVILNSGTSSVTDKSQYYVRAGFTQWTVSIPLVQWAYDQGMKNAVVLAADYAPGHDALEAFGKTFAKLGGKVVGEIKVPMGTTDFSSYLQRVRDLKPQAVFMFMPVGPMSAGMIRSFKERELDKAGITLLVTNEAQEEDIAPIGDAALGLTSALHYSPYLDTPLNKEFVTAYKAKYGKDELPSVASVAAYDGMRLIERMVGATNGVKDGDKAMAAIKDYKWDSPRGPVSIDPRTREIVQNVYMRKVEKIDGKLGNKVFHTYPAVKDPWHEINK